MVSPLVCAADKYGIGIHIQSLLWVVDNPLSTWLTMEVTAPENVYVGGGSSEKKYTDEKYVRLRLKVNVSKIWCCALSPCYAC